MITEPISRFVRSLGTAMLIAMSFLAAATRPADSATTRRYTIDDHGNYMIFGNTVGFDCRDNLVQKPVVGQVPIGLLGLFSCNGVLPDNDSGIDILWRSDYPGTNQAAASNLIDPNGARSTAVFVPPPGAKVMMARLYWAAQRSQGQGAGTSVTLERPGSFSRRVQAEAGASKTVTLNGFDYYQSSADVTADLQKYGQGPFRVGDIDTFDVRTVNEDVMFVAWNIVVVYHLDSDPIRNLAIFDGLERVSTGSGGSQTIVNLNGFSIPNTGFEAHLGVIAYEGDNEITGDSLLVNGTAISNSNNPADNFFNRTSTAYNVLMPRTGDLPQMTGAPASMAGYDSDIIDITPRISGNDTQIVLKATTTGDEYFLGVLAIGVSTIRPVFSNTNKTVKNLSRNDGRYLPGDKLEYTISTSNTGNDTGKLVSVSDQLPMGLNFVTGSLSTTGATAGNWTDAPDTDQAEYVPANRTVTARLGSGATGSVGGSLAVGESASLIFQVTIDSAATGTIVNQAFVTAIGQTAQGQGGNPITWPSGGGGGVNVGTPVTVDTCNTNADCPISAPICDTSTTPHQCVCRGNADCPGGQVCDTTTTHQCVECLPPSNAGCDPNGPGGLCLPTDTCGCNSNTDCNGRACDTGTHTCAAVNTDLSLTLTRTPTGVIIPPGTPLTYTLTVDNKGSVAINGAELSAVLVPNLAGAAWTCVAKNGAACPAQSGNAPLDTLVNLPASGELVYTFTATTSTDPASDTLDFTGTLTPPRGYVDTNPADNLVTDSVIVGVPPLGPDLSIDVSEMPSTDDSSVDYVVQVTNHGPDTAAGATVTYDVPAGATATVTSSDGWNCQQPNNGAQIVCTNSQPIPVGMAAPIDIHVLAQPNQASIPLKVTVLGTDGTGSPLSDPNPADNTVERTTTLNQFKLVGGGFVAGCSVGGASGNKTQSDATMILLCGLFGLTLLVRASRRTARQSSSI